MFRIDKVPYDFQTFYINYASRYPRYKDISLKICDFFFKPVLLKARLSIPDILRFYCLLKLLKHLLRPHQGAVKIFYNTECEHMNYLTNENLQTLIFLMIKCC